MENLRYILSQYRPETSLYIGHRFVNMEIRDGFMAGGGYVLSKKALHKFVNERIHDPKCRQDWRGAEDCEMGKCLEGHAIKIDAHDDLGQNQFFPLGPERYMNKQSFGKRWYEQMEWESYERGGLGGISETITCMHYVSPKEMFSLNYLIFKTHPFGLVREKDELPLKFSLREILKASNVGSKSEYYVTHEPVLNLDEDEKY